MSTGQYAPMGDDGALPIQSQPKPKSKGLIWMVVAAVAIGALVVIMMTLRHDDDSDSCPAVGSPLPKNMSDKDVLPSDMQCRMKGMMDESVDPCDDFYHYACGGWIKENEKKLSEQEPEIVVSFTQIGVEVQKELIKVRQEKYPFVEELAASCKDSSALTIQALAPYYRKALNEVTNVPTFLQAVGELQAEGIAFGAGFGWSVEQNVWGDARENVLMVMPDGLTFGATMDSFPTDDYIAAVFPAFEALEKYNVIANATTAFRGVLDLETKLFARMVEPDFNDPATWNTTFKQGTLAEFETKTGMDLSGFVAALSPDRNIAQVAWTDSNNWNEILETLTTAGAPELRSYLVWRVTLGMLRFLPQEFQQVADKLVATFGTDSPYPWPTTSNLRVTEPDQYRGLSARIPENMRRPHMRNHRGRNMNPAEVRALGARMLAATESRDQYCDELAYATFETWYMHQYLVQDFPEVDLELAHRLVNETRAHLKQRLETIKWLDEPTRTKALEKLAHLVPNVATDPFEGTRGLAALNASSPLENYRTVVQWRLNRMLDTAGTAFNRSSYQGSPYEMGPWVQNAYYQPTSNTINMLPGLMLPPMFSPDLPYSLNVAAYIMVIGHECTHGYDNSGRLFGPYGAYENWWTPEAIEQFDNRTQCLINQYSEFEAFGVHVNGSQTLGENIADGGGVDMAWSVYKDIKPAPKKEMLDGITNDQLHFLYYAQTWCTALTKEAYENQVYGDVHSPDQFRIRGPLSNFKPFAEAYGCKADQYYGRSLTDKACHVW